MRHFRPRIEMFLKLSKINDIVICIQKMNKKWRVFVEIFILGHSQ